MGFLDTTRRIHFFKEDKLFIEYKISYNKKNIIYSSRKEGVL